MLVEVVAFDEGEIHEGAVAISQLLLPVWKIFVQVNLIFCVRNRNRGAMRIEKKRQATLDESVSDGLQPLGVVLFIWAPHIDEPDFGRRRSRWKYWELLWLVAAGRESKSPLREPFAVAVLALDLGTPERFEQHETADSLAAFPLLVLRVGRKERIEIDVSETDAIVCYDEIVDVAVNFDAGKNCVTFCGIPMAGEAIVSPSSLIAWGQLCTVV